MRRVLFLPSYFGNGFGHVSRCLAVADEMSARGWRAGFVVAGHHAPAVQKSGYTVFEPVFPARPRKSKGTWPAYTYVTDCDVQVLRDGLIGPWRLWAAVSEGLAMVRRFKPDVLVGDTSFLTWILGTRADLPVVQIVQSMTLPGNGPLIWWEKPPEGSVSPDIHPVFDNMLDRWKLPSVKSAEDLLRGDLYLVPSIPELDPIGGDSHAVFHVGPLVRSRPHAADHDFLGGWGRDHLIYVTLGGGAGPVGSRRLLETIKNAFAGSPWSVLVSTGLKFQPETLGASPPNVRFEQWVPGLRAIERSKAVVFHGGHGTTMEVVRCGVPGVVIPFHSEQESNGRRLASFSAAKVLTVRSPSSRRLIRRKWKYGDFAYWVHDDNPITPSDVSSAVTCVLEDERYRKGALRLRAAAEKYSGSVGAADLVIHLATGGLTNQEDNMRRK